MWPIDDIEIRNVQLDFTSSSGGRPRTHAIYASETCLVNALEYTNLNEDPAQLIVCESCGNVHCQPGGWVQIRRIADTIAFVPAFAEMLSGDFNSTEYSPPQYLSSRGTPLFALGTYQRMRAQAPAFPSIGNIKSINASEAIRLIQWHAPLRVLGSFPHQPQLIRDAILAVSDGDFDDQCELVQRFIDNNFGSSAKLSAIDGDSTKPIEFHLDGPRFPAWRPFASIGGELVFNLEPIAKLIVAGEPPA
jgi:hypothetical protein